MFDCKLPGNCKAQSAATGVYAARGLQAIERTKYCFVMFGGDTRTAVANPDAYGPLITLPVNINRLAVSVKNGIIQRANHTAHYNETCQQGQQDVPDPAVQDATQQRTQSREQLRDQTGDGPQQKQAQTRSRYEQNEGQAQGQGYGKGKGQGQKKGEGRG